VQTNSEPFKPSQDIQAFCTRHGIQFESYSTLGGQYTAVSGKQSPVLTHPTVIRLAEKYHRHPSQIILRWALQHGSTVIPRSKDALHQAQNLQVFDFDLTDQDLLSIDSLSQHTL
jgi:diketogulonate reductase-like aldo/keto reductase